MRSAALIFVLAGAALAADGNTFITDTKTPTAEAPLFGTGTWFRRSFTTPPAPKIELQPPLRLRDAVAGDKLELSLRTYMDLVLANNTDVQVERLTIETARNEILRRYSIFDPFLSGNFTSTRTDSLAVQRFQVSDNLDISQLSQPARFSYTHMLPTGTTYNVGFNASKLSTNDASNLFNPSLNSSLNVSFSQPLLRNRGAYLTRLPITIARSRLKATGFDIESRLLRVVADAENAYWDVILAREDLRVQEQALALADTSLKRAQRELELGAISSLEIYQPQQQYANFEILVTQARFRLQEAENILRRYISADLDPQVRNLPLVLTEEITPPVQTQLDREQLVTTALELRPDLKNRRQVLDVDDLSIQSAANGLRPNFALTGQYGSFGQGVRRDGTLWYPGGFGNALDQMFGFGYPTYGFGLSLQLPIRDRRASADYADAVVNKRLDLLRLRSQEQQVRQEVLNAATRVEGSRASVDLARIALDFAQKRVDADQKRYDLGTITLFFLLDSQNALTRAQSELVNQMVNYRKNLVNLQRNTAELLRERNITVQ